MKQPGFLIFLTLGIICSCSIEKSRTGIIKEFVIGFSEEPNCPYLGFKIISEDTDFKKVFEEGEKYYIGISGAFFNDSLFSMSDPKIRSVNGDTIIITSRSCYFSAKSQLEVDSIAENTINEISITISEDKREWFFQKEILNYNSYEIWREISICRV